jgi:NADPH-dependent curcumin reductase CurA
MVASAMPTGREIRLAARPSGMPRPGDFALVEVDVPEPGPGEVLVRNLWMSVDPYMRPRMNDVPSYVPAYELGRVLDGPAVGAVVASRAEGLAPGDTVVHWQGWRDLALLGGREARRVDTDVAPAQAYIGVLGMSGLTAYVGLLDIAGLREGDVVFVSAAAGMVGSLAGQIARLRGHRTIGSAGTDAKVAHLRDDLGFDAAFNYRSGDVADLLREAAPDGIDVYFDNVGGDHLEAAIDVLREHGRVAMCGAISTYNSAGAAPPTLRNQFKIVGKRLTLRGFIASDHMRRMREFREVAGPWLRDGRIVARETVFEGLERAPDAFIALLGGENVGKMLVRIA